MPWRTIPSLVPRRASWAGLALLLACLFGISSAVLGAQREGKVHPGEVLTHAWQPDKVVSVTGDLVLISTLDGKMHAVDAFSGKIKWSFDADRTHMLYYDAFL